MHNFVSNDSNVKNNLMGSNDKDTSWENDIAVSKYYFFINDYANKLLINSRPKQGFHTENFQFIVDIKMRKLFPLFLFIRGFPGSYS